MKKKAFTLIELLVVLAILGVLVSIILVWSSNAVNRSKRTAALKTAASIMSELTVCADEGGYAVTVAPAGKYICCSALSAGDCVSAKPGHPAMWPSLGTTGWGYQAPINTLASNDYQYKITKTGETEIVCSISNRVCQ